MNIRAKSEKGFSLIELLVVVAIIGVLAAVGVVGYQGYIDSTKKSVTESNAKAVHQWILNTKTVRAAGITVKPSSCDGSSVNLDTCFQGASGIAASGNPFNGFKNPYDTAQTGTGAIVGYDSASAPTTGTTTCVSAVAGTTKGDIIIRYSSTGLGTSGATIGVYYCDEEGKFAQQTGLTDITWD